MAGGDRNAGGLSGSLRRLFATLLLVWQNRLEMAAVELNEEKFRLLEVLILGAACFVFGIVALLTITAPLVIMLWDPAGVPLLIGFSIVYFLAALLAILALRNKIRNWPPTFAHTVAEIKKDSECLRTLP